MSHATAKRFRNLETIQREHELNEALKAARAFQSRLEMLGDRPREVELVRSLRDSLAAEMEIGR